MKFIQGHNRNQIYLFQGKQYIITKFRPCLYPFVSVQKDPAEKVIRQAAVKDNCAKKRDCNQAANLTGHYQAQLLFNSR